MRRTWMIAAALAAGLMTLAGAAYAQFIDYEYEVERRAWDIHVGFGWLSGEIEDDTTWIVGATYEYPIYIRDGISEDFVTFGVDYYPVDSPTTGTESIVPILVGYRKYGILGGYKLFFGFGVGVRWASNDIPELDISQDFDFEWDVSAGVNFTPNFFGRARYLAGGDPSDDGLFTLELGYRF